MISSCSLYVGLGVFDHQFMLSRSSILNKNAIANYHPRTSIVMLFCAFFVGNQEMKVLVDFIYSSFPGLVFKSVFSSKDIPETPNNKSGVIK